MDDKLQIGKIEQLTNERDNSRAYAQIVSTGNHEIQKLCADLARKLGMSHDGLQTPQKILQVFEAELATLRSQNAKMLAALDRIQHIVKHGLPRQYATSDFEQSDFEQREISAIIDEIRSGESNPYPFAVGKQVVLLEERWRPNSDKLGMVKKGAIGTILKIDTDTTIYVDFEPRQPGGWMCYDYEIDPTGEDRT